MDRQICGCVDRSPPLPPGVEVSSLLAVRVDWMIHRAYARGCREFLCGSGPVGDLHFAESVLNMRMPEPVRLVLLSPLTDYTKRWPLWIQERYQSIFARCEQMLFFPKEGEDYQRDAQAVRAYIEKNAHRLLVVEAGGRVREGTGEAAWPTPAAT